MFGFFFHSICQEGKKNASVFYLCVQVRSNLNSVCVL